MKKRKLVNEAEQVDVVSNVTQANIEKELSYVKPLVDEAAHAVAGISADTLTEIRSMRAPPAPVRDILEAVLMLMGIRDTSWNSMKTFLSKRGVKDDIRYSFNFQAIYMKPCKRKINKQVIKMGIARCNRNWDARQSSPVNLEAVAKITQQRPESFQEVTAKRASVAAAPLASWVIANLKYGQVVQQIAPYEREQRELSR